MGVRPVLPQFTGTRFVTGAAVLLGMSVLAACTSAGSPGGTAPTSSPTTPIIIGASLSLSPGPAANPDTFQADGLAFEKGYELWAQDVNGLGGGGPVRNGVRGRGGRRAVGLRHPVQPG